MKRFIKKTALQNTPIFFLLCFAAQLMCAESMRIANVRFEMNDTVVVIRYDILTKKEMKMQSTENFDTDEYNIVAVLRKESDPQFSYTLTQVTGDIGKGHWSGKNKKVIWDIQKEFSNGLDGTDYFFEVRAEPIIAESDNTMLWIGVSATVVAGGLATFFIVTNNKHAQEPGSFPLPPGRPR